MRSTVLTACLAGYVGLAAGIWLKSTVLATASPTPAPTTAMVPHDLMRAAPANLPVVEVRDPF